MVNITLSLPDELIEQAKEYGILTDARVAALLDAELKRLKSWRDFQPMLEGLHAASREHFGDLSEEEFMALVESEVKSVREERRNPTQGNN